MEHKMKCWRESSNKPIQFATSLLLSYAQHLLANSKYVYLFAFQSKVFFFFMRCSMCMTCKETFLQELLTRKLDIDSASQKLLLFYVVRVQILAQDFRRYSFFPHLSALCQHFSFPI